MTMGRMPIRGVPRPRNRLLTLAEFAEEFGVTRFQLQAYLSNSPTAPKFELQHKSTPTMPARTYYKVREMRAWWAEQKKETV
jgi:hypothetical protein